MEKRDAMKSFLMSDTRPRWAIVEVGGKEIPALCSMDMQEAYFTKDYEATTQIPEFKFIRWMSMMEFL